MTLTVENKINPLEFSEKMEQESPVLIVGAPRSGSSLLYRTIQNHSHFKPRNCQEHSGIEFTESKVFDNPYRLYSLSNNKDAFSYFLKDEKLYNKFLEETRNIQNYQRRLIGKLIVYKFCRKLNESNFSNLRKGIWEITQSDNLIRFFFYYAQQARGAARIVEKTPTQI